jgi:hypothetical protein
MASHRPLDVEQLDRLETLLEQRAVPFQGMGLEMLDGFLSARALAPVVLDDDWHAQVWGPTPPRWESADEAAEGRGHPTRELVLVVVGVVMLPLGATVQSTDQPSTGTPAPSVTRTTGVKVCPSTIVVVVGEPNALIW